MMSFVKNMFTTSRVASDYSSRSSQKPTPLGIPSGAVHKAFQAEGILPGDRQQKKSSTLVAWKEKEMDNLTTKYKYSRPVFLKIETAEEQTAAMDHQLRQLCLPKRLCLPNNAGYAECINGGKSQQNEDQAVAVKVNLCEPPVDWTDSTEWAETEAIIQHHPDLDSCVMFGIYDGHAGVDVALTSSHELHDIIKKRLRDVYPDMVSIQNGELQNDPENFTNFQYKKPMTIDGLITGALEASFQEMDSHLVEDALTYAVKGGCTALVTLFYAGKVYVANAGDSRAVMKIGDRAIAMSTDFTPEADRKRLQLIAELNPDLLGDEFCATQFYKRVTRKDLGCSVLYRNSCMEGWANKTIMLNDLRFPMISGEGRRSRLLATIGVTRGFGDHDLRVFDTNISIKPFLTSAPQVISHDLDDENLDADDVLVMGTDGLWDVMTSELAVQLVSDFLKEHPKDDPARYMSAAHNLVAFARGTPKKDNPQTWLLSNGEYASVDDISCFVIPLRDIFERRNVIAATDSIPSNALSVIPQNERPGSPQMSVTPPSVSQAPPLLYEQNLVPESSGRSSAAGIGFYGSRTPTVLRSAEKTQNTAQRTCQANVAKVSEQFGNIPDLLTQTSVIDGSDTDVLLYDDGVSINIRAENTHQPDQLLGYVFVHPTEQSDQLKQAEEIGLNLKAEASYGSTRL